MELKVCYPSNTSSNHQDLNIFISSKRIKKMFVKIIKITIAMMICIPIQNSFFWLSPAADLQVISALNKFFADSKPNSIASANYYSFFSFSHLYHPHTFLKSLTINEELISLKQHEMLWRLCQSPELFRTYSCYIFSS